MFVDAAARESVRVRSQCFVDRFPCEIVGVSGAVSGLQIPLPLRGEGGCYSARRLRADRRDELLKWLDTGGSQLHAEQHPGSQRRAFPLHGAR